MTSKLLSGFCALALSCSAAFGQTPLFYENVGVVLAPPEIPPTIDAVNFVNQGQFVINMTNLLPAMYPYQAPFPYETQRTDNYTNAFGAFLSCNSGFRLETFVRDAEPRRMATSIHNEGVIHCGTVDTTNSLNIYSPLSYFVAGVQIVGSTPMGKFLGRAADIVNAGDINLGFEGNCSLIGENIKLDRGSINMETEGFSLVNGDLFANGLVADGYWGLSTNVIGSPAAFFGVNPPFTPQHLVTNRNYQLFYQQLGGPTFQSYWTVETDGSGSNNFYRAVFLANTNLDMPANVYFNPYGPTIVEWVNSDANGDNLVLFDYFQYWTNYDLVIGGISGARPTYIPWNFSFARYPSFYSGLFGVPAVAATIPGNFFVNANITNQYAAYRALLQPNSIILHDIFGQTYANSPGRVEIDASKFLSMDHTRISSLNYLKVMATNQFGGSVGSTIGSPYSEFHLRSTNGSLSISNLTVPTLNRNEGNIDCYSGRWTNVINGVTNNYCVLFVDVHASEKAPTRVVGLTLRVTDPAGAPDQILISDQMNIVSNKILIDCSRLTITTNATDAPVPFGSLNFMDPSIVWSGITPRLQYLTNEGMILAENTMFFRGSRTSPYYSATFNEPYEGFVNRGGVTNFSSRIFAKDFQNSGVFLANGGSIELHQNLRALLTNDMILAPTGVGAIIFETGEMFASNHVFIAGGALTLSVTNLLDDGSLGSYGADGVTNKNGWIVGNGVNLTQRPAQASLLGTTITNRAKDYQRAVNYWAGQDRGADPAGYVNNAAIGRLVLDGGFHAQYHFTGPGAGSALYVDTIELLHGAATNVDLAGNFMSLTCDPNMKVYFGQALANGASIAQKLAAVNGGRFIWVSNYHSGFFCTTNVVYADGSTNRLNTALVTSCDIDSNGDGIPNCNDPSPVPILTPAGLALSVDYVQGSTPAAQVSWKAFPKTFNTLLSAPSSDAKDWQVVTNFTYTGAFPDRVQVMDLIKTNVPRFYRVRVNAQQ